jgi:hypothetical protein
MYRGPIKHVHGIIISFISIHIHGYDVKILAIASSLPSALISVNMAPIVLTSISVAPMRNSLSMMFSVFVQTLSSGG